MVTIMHSSSAAFYRENLSPNVPNTVFRYSDTNSWSSSRRGMPPPPPPTFQPPTPPLPPAFRPPVFVPPPPQHSVTDSVNKPAVECSFAKRGGPTSIVTPQVLHTQRTKHSSSSASSLQRRFCVDFCDQRVRTAGAACQSNHGVIGEIRSTQSLLERKTEKRISTGGVSQTSTRASRNSVSSRESLAESFTREKTRKTVARDEPSKASECSKASKVSIERNSVPQEGVGEDTASAVRRRPFPSLHLYDSAIYSIRHRRTLDGGLERPTTPESDGTHRNGSSRRCSDLLKREGCGDDLVVVMKPYPSRPSRKERQLLPTISCLHGSESQIESSSNRIKSTCQDSNKTTTTCDNEGAGWRQLKGGRSRRLPKEVRCNATTQFLKTKWCPFKDEPSGCRRYQYFSCPFAHSEEEKRPIPNLVKTAMCKGFQLGLCSKSSSDCLFAHNLMELKSTDAFYKTGMCRFWIAGNCTAGDTCRHAHGDIDRSRAQRKTDDVNCKSAQVEEKELADPETTYTDQQRSSTPSIVFSEDETSLRSIPDLEAPESPVPGSPNTQSPNHTDVWCVDNDGEGRSPHIDDTRSTLRSFASPPVAEGPVSTQIYESANSYDSPAPDDSSRGSPSHGLLVEPLFDVSPQTVVGLKQNMLPHRDPKDIDTPVGEQSESPLSLSAAPSRTFSSAGASCGSQESLRDGIDHCFLDSIGGEMGRGDKRGDSSSETPPSSFTREDEEGGRMMDESDTLSMIGIEASSPGLLCEQAEQWAGYYEDVRSHVNQVARRLTYAEQDALTKRTATYKSNTPPSDSTTTTQDGIDVDNGRSGNAVDGYTSSGCARLAILTAITSTVKSTEAAVSDSEQTKEFFLTENYSCEGSGLKGAEDDRATSHGMEASGLHSVEDIRLHSVGNCGTSQTTSTCATVHAGCSFAPFTMPQLIAPTICSPSHVQSHSSTISANCCGQGHQSSIPEPQLITISNDVMSSSVDHPNYFYPYLSSSTLPICHSGPATSHGDFGLPLSCPRPVPGPATTGSCYPAICYVVAYTGYPHDGQNYNCPVNHGSCGGDQLPGGAFPVQQALSSIPCEQLPVLPTAVGASHSCILPPSNHCQPFHPLYAVLSSTTNPVNVDGTMPNASCPIDTRLCQSSDWSEGLKTDRASYNPVTSPGRYTGGMGIHHKVTVGTASADSQRVACCGPHGCLRELWSRRMS
eukprot:GHVQ01005832.1.p1 GENE.GHVQ01005832.1~~GHVQ01005832.1.p1  ORF type:complete len:1195 (+),score=158.02 GHVQ01005832.1:466-4050(+)